MNASYRLNTCKSRGSGIVAIQTFPALGNSLPKGRLMPDVTVFPHGDSVKDSSVRDGDAFH